tara:strand:+ start:174 stop:527 length:354 start_codon:yes stop_codon:yes gene_type:complete
MDRNFDRETYLNKEKYDEAVKKENEEKEKLISQRVEDMQREMDYVERQWRYLRKCIAMDIRVAIAKNDGMNDEGLELMSGLAEEFFDKFLVSAGVRLPPGSCIRSRAENSLRSEHII